MSFTDQNYDTSGPRSVATFNESDRAPEEGSFSVIDRFSTFDGTFVAERDLRVDGEVKGTIECKGTLFVAEGAVVNARVEAENITVSGDLTGDIECTGRLQLLPSGKLKGRVKTKGFVIAQGAIYDGDLVMESNTIRPPAAESPVAPETQAPAPPRRTSSRSSTAQPRHAEPAASGETATPSTFIRRLGGPETPWDGQESEGAAPEAEPAES